MTRRISQFPVIVAERFGFPFLFLSCGIRGILGVGVRNVIFLLEKNDKGGNYAR